MKMTTIALLIAGLMGSVANSETFQGKGDKTYTIKNGKVSFQPTKTKAPLKILDDSIPGNPTPDPFPEPEPLEPIRYGTWRAKVSKWVTEFHDDGSISLEEVEVCSKVAVLPVYDVRGRENYIVEIPDNTQINCDVEVDGIPGTVNVFGSVDIITDQDPFSAQFVDYKSFSAAAYVTSMSNPEQDFASRFISMAGSSKDLGISNLILRGGESGTVSSCSSDGAENPEPSPEDPENPIPLADGDNNDLPDEDDDGDSDCPENQISEFYFVYADLLDNGQQ